MTDILATQAKILSFIDISQFTDDLRLVIFDYMYPRRVNYITQDEKSYCYRLGPHLQDNQLFLEIIAYTKNFSRVLSTFGTYCEQKAIHEYESLRKDISNNISFNISFDWETCFFTRRVFGNNMVFHHLYAFCLDNQSTIMFQIDAQPQIGFGTRFIHYSLRNSTTVWDEIKNCVKTEYYWSSGRGSRQYGSIADAMSDTIAFHKNALKNGSELNERDVASLYYLQPQFIVELLTEKEHSMCTYA